MPDGGFEVGREPLQSLAKIFLPVAALGDGDGGPHDAAVAQTPFAKDEDRHDRHPGGAGQGGGAERKRVGAAEETDLHRPAPGTRAVALKGHDLVAPQGIQEGHAELRVLGEMGGVELAATAPDQPLDELLSPRIGLRLAHDVNPPALVGSRQHRSHLPGADVGGDQDETAAGARQLAPCFQAFGLDGEIPVRAQPLVALREAPGESKEGPVDATLALPPAAGPEDRLEVGGDGGADLAQGEPEERREDGDRQPQGRSGKDLHSEAVETEPEHPGDVKRPQQTAAPAAFGRVRRRFRRAVARQGYAHGSGISSPLFSHGSDRRSSRASNAGSTRTVASRHAERPRDTRMPACRSPGTREPARLPKPITVVSVASDSPRPMSAGAPLSPRSGCRRRQWTALAPRVVPVPRSKGTVKAHSRSRGRPRAPQSPNVQRTPRVSGSMARRASRTRPRNEKSTTAPTRTRARALDRARSVRAMSRSSAPTQEMDARATSRRLGDRCERSRARAAGSTLAPAPRGSRTCRATTALPAPPAVGPSRTSSDIQRGHCAKDGAPGSSPRPSARRLASAAAKGSSLKPAAVSSR